MGSVRFESLKDFLKKFAPETKVPDRLADGALVLERASGGPAMAADDDGEGVDDITFLGDIPVDAVIELGRRRMVLQELAALDVDDIVELDQAMDRPLDLVVGDKVLARGELVMVGERVALRITELIGRSKDEE